MRIHITIPEEHVGKVIGDLNSRRAHINESVAQDASETGNTSRLTRDIINAFYPTIRNISIHDTSTFNDTGTRRIYVGIFTLRDSTRVTRTGRETCWHGLTSVCFHHRPELRQRDRTHRSDRCVQWSSLPSSSN